MKFILGRLYMCSTLWITDSHLQQHLKSTWSFGCSADPCRTLIEPGFWHWAKIGSKRKINSGSEPAPFAYTHGTINWQQEKEHGWRKSPTYVPYGRGTLDLSAKGSSGRVSAPRFGKEKVTIAMGRRPFHNILYLTRIVPWGGWLF